MIKMFRRFLSNPGMIGSITPSSSALAEAMTRQVSNGVAVFEIGAGTGVITRHIQKTAPLGSLVVFEQDHFLAAHLRCQIGHARVIEGLFHDTVDGLGEIPDALDILSSLPFKSLSEDIHEKTVAAICDLLLASPNRRLIQYTYFDAPPFIPRHQSLRWRRLSRVWANIPPATVWELRAEPGSARITTLRSGAERTRNGKSQARLAGVSERQS
jgi:phosphatidylethanolamine/phosphatidyl-N-methylethanolamine N-methyltransferase